MDKRLENILRMEGYYDCLRAAVIFAGESLTADETLREMLTELTAYYDGGQWLADYELDEQGLLPPWLKRGVLSQDGLYNLLCEISENET